MALRLSKALRDFMMSGGSLKDALQGGKILIYDGPQPASADAAPTGTLLLTLTDNGGAHTAEVQATGTATLAGSSGSVDNLTVDGIEVLGGSVPFTTDLATTAAKVAAKINANPHNQLVKASAAGAVVTLKMRRGWGALANGLAVVTTLTTMTSTDVDIGSGVAGVTSINGLRFGEGATGTVAKDATQTWQGTCVAGGVAGWFRFVGAVADSGIADSSETQIRIDGSIAVSGADYNWTNTTFANGSVQTGGGFQITQPTL